ncbi:MAG: DUF4079 domain-containing protein [Pseudomonadota bacterium]
MPWMWIHPTLQLAGLLLGLYALYLGWRRFAFAHLGRKVIFLWKRHVALGSTVMAIWLAGLLLGLGMAWWAWGVVLITGLHHQTALLMVPLLGFGYFSGLVMHRRKAKRKVLPLAHAVNNLLLVLLTLSQLATGAVIVRDYLLP